MNVSEPVPVNHGGLTAGTHINGLNPCDVLQMILYPYQAPSFTSFYMEGQNTVLEVGDKVTGGVRVFHWSTSNSQNILPNSILIRDLTTNQILASNLDNDGSESVDIGSDKIKTTAGNYTWRIEGTNTKNQTFSRNYTVEWRYRVYWGSNPNPSLTEEEIKNLQNSELKTNFNGTYSFNVISGGDGDYFYIVYPNAWGSINQTADCTNGFGWDITEIGVVNVTNNFGVTIPYKVVRTTYKQTQNGCVNVS
jgi:hypothetical protein